MKQRKKIKPPIVLRMTTWAFPRVEKIFPWFAKRWFVSIFFSTAKYKLPHGEIEMAQKANTYHIEHDGKRVQVYEWGEGKPILMVHGWMGRATQFRKFIAEFNTAGYKVVAFDGIGHGKSQGSSSHLKHFIDIILKLQDNYRQFEMIIGHSLGGVASFHAVLKGVSDKLVMISSPTIAEDILTEFRKKIGASKKVLPYFQEQVKKEFKITFEEFSVSYNIDQLKGVELLLIHDEDDKEVPASNAQLIKDRYPYAHLKLTTGQGHTRILKDPIVVEEALNFANKSSLMFA